MRAEPKAARHVFVRLAVLAVAAELGCAPVKPQVGPRLAFPFWTVADARPRVVGCAQVVLWISKTGKRGLGASLALTAPAGPCQVRLESAKLFVAGRPVARAAVPPPLFLGKGEVVRDYLPFFFDNEAAWNRGDREGRLELAVAAGTARVTLTAPLFERVYPFLGVPSEPTPGKYTVTPIYPNEKQEAKP